MEKTEKDLITVLSIDGGGVRGIIPATILEFLESYLQWQEKDKNVRIADYFDYIAGTSTGGLVAAMLTSPDLDDGSSEPKRAFATDKIKKFYHEESPKIFPQKSQNEASVVGSGRSSSTPGLFSRILNKGKSILEFIFLPKYDGGMLTVAIKAKVGKKRLSETLTNVIIPSFDIELLQLQVFSTLKARREALEDVDLLDVCLSTSAAPCFLPPHKFEKKRLNSFKKFNMVDGGVAANNPTFVALLEIAKEISKDGKTPCLSNMDFRKILILSLGTGSSKRNNQGFYVPTGGPFEWLALKNGAVPIIEVLLTASDDMVHLCLSSLFQGTEFEKNYLRIQCDSLKDSETAMSNSDKGNLENLEKIGNDLLKNPVSAVDSATGLLEPIEGGGTNEDALKKFGDRLLAERKRRQDKLRLVSVPVSEWP